MASQFEALLAGLLSNDNFGFGQLVVGQAGQGTTVSLVDLVNNGNRGAGDAPEALYLFGLGSGTEGLRIGIELPAELARTSTSFDLAMGSERYGQLLVLKSAMADPIEGRFGAIRLASLAAFATSALAALMMVLRIRRSRRASD